MPEPVLGTEYGTSFEHQGFLSFLIQILHRMYLSIDLEYPYESELLFEPNHHQMLTVEKT